MNTDKDIIMKKMLMLATTAAMIEQFNKDNILILEELGYEVHMAGNFEEGNPISDERLAEFKIWLESHHGKCFHIPATRKPSDIKNNRKALKMVVSLTKEYNYDFIHCHTPIGSIIGRLAGKKTKTPVIYTAHGFHFFKGAPIKNWLLYYPAEWICSWMTELLITINREDYRRAKRHMHAKKVAYIPGVGVDVEQFKDYTIDKEKLRKKLKLPEDAFVLLSVGELSDRKNQMIVIEAMKELNNPNVYYLMVGQGELAGAYKQKIKEYNLTNNIKMLGFRNDIQALCKCVDCFIHPSIREGLGIAPLEAMASGLPLISANVNGMKDYTVNGKSGCCVDPNSVSSVVNAINKIYSDPEFAKKCSEFNQKKVRLYDIKRSNHHMRNLYSSFIKSEKK